MNPIRNRGLAAGAVLAASLWLMSGCHQSGALDAGAQAGTADHAMSPSRSIPAGTRIEVVLETTISSESARLGDTWRGRVARTVSLPDGGSIEAGSGVTGDVAEVTAARRGSRARLELGLTGIRLNGTLSPVAGSAAAVTAGSTRKRNVGAIAGGVVAGALLGRMVGDGRNAAAGGLIGGAAATGVVAESKGFQVVLGAGRTMSFTINQNVAMR